MMLFDRLTSASEQEEEFRQLAETSSTMSGPAVLNRAGELQRIETERNRVIEAIRTEWNEDMQWRPQKILTNYSKARGETTKLLYSHRNH
jgi:hypothetical protein